MGSNIIHAQMLSKIKYGQNIKLYFQFLDFAFLKLQNLDKPTTTHINKYKSNCTYRFYRPHRSNPFTTLRFFSVQTTFSSLMSGNY